MLPLALVASSAYAGVQYYTTRPAYLLEAGREAVAHGNWEAADRLAKELERRGHATHARLLFGTFWLEKGKVLARSEPPPLPVESLQRAGQRLLGAAGLAAQPIPLRAPSWLAAAFLQTPVPPRSRAPAAFQRALAELTQVLDDGPLGVDGTVLAAECLIHLKQRRLPVEALHAVVRRRPDHVQAHRLLAAVYIDLSSPSDAVRHLREWGRLDPDDGRPFRWVGFFCKDYGKAAEAVDAYREARRRNLEPAARAEVTQELVQTLVEKARYQEGLDVLDEGTPAREDAELLALRAEALHGLARPAAAVPLLDRALELRPNLGRALLLRARISLGEDRPREAVPLLERLVGLEPFDVKARKNLMEAYRLTGDAARAERERRRLAEAQEHQDRLTDLQKDAIAQPWNDQVRYRIALLCWKVRRPAETRMWLQAALACNPGNLAVRRALADLGGL